MAATVAPPRIGARRRADIPPAVLEQLNRGELETASLAEGLAVNFASLLETCAPQLPLSAIATMREAQPLGVTRRMAVAGALLLEYGGPAEYLRLLRHRADTVRGWAAYLLAASPDFTLSERLRLIRPLANDRNSGVREWAWLALRPHLAREIEQAIELLEPWVFSPSPFLRRFAVESTRPRGVWCTHIEALKQDPSPGLLLLAPLRGDPHRYVQDSVANWLNDAAKSQPEFVRELCVRWCRESDSPATERICRRALRSLGAIKQHARRVR